MLFATFKNNEMSELCKEKNKVKGITYYRAPQNFNPKKDRLYLENGKVKIKFGAKEAFDQEQEVLSRISSYVESLKENLKLECNRRIRTINGRELTQNEWLQKSQNYQDIKQTYTTDLLARTAKTELEYTQEEYAHACEIIERKNKLVRRYHAIKKELLKSSLERIEEFIESQEYLDDACWEDL